MTATEVAERHEEFQFALPHGERRKKTGLRNTAACFNSRSRMGSDMTATEVAERHEEFQFALPHGERLSCLWE